MKSWKMGNGEEKQTCVLHNNPELPVVYAHTKSRIRQQEVNNIQRSPRKETVTFDRRF